MITLDIEETLKLLRELRQLMAVHGESRWATTLSDFETRLFSAADDWPQAVKIVRELDLIWGGPAGGGGLSEFDFQNPDQASYAAHLNRFEQIRIRMGEMISAAREESLPEDPPAEPL